MLWCTSLFWTPLQNFINEIEGQIFDSWYCKLGTRWVLYIMKTRYWLERKMKGAIVRKKSLSYLRLKTCSYCNLSALESYILTNTLIRICMLHYEHEKNFIIGKCEWKMTKYNRNIHKHLTNKVQIHMKIIDISYHSITHLCNFLIYNHIRINICEK